MTCLTPTATRLAGLIAEWPGITTPELVQVTSNGAEKWRHHVIAELRRLHRNAILRRRATRRNGVRVIGWRLTEYGKRTIEGK